MHTVKISGRTFNMTDKQLKDTLAFAASKVKCGVYAIEHKSKDYFEMVNEPMSKTQIKAAKRRLKSQGIKVYANGV